jgi:cob(I)alamin adenosyltransferase
VNSLGHIYLYYGDGGGKTTSALGLALRSVGHKHRVVIVQFLKWFKNTGECKIQPTMSPYYSIYQFGEPGWLRIDETNRHHEFSNLKTRKPREKDRLAAKKGLDFARKILVEEKPALLILDEVCLAVHFGLLPVDDVLKLVENIPENINVVMTGRYAPRELVEKADFVNKIISEKAPTNFVNVEGIQF